jgi:hypothetical protein
MRFKRFSQKNIQLINFKPKKNNDKTYLSEIASIAIHITMKDGSSRKVTASESVKLKALNLIGRAEKLKIINTNKINIMGNFKIGHYDEALRTMQQSEIKDNLEAIAYGLQDKVTQKSNRRDY